MSYMFGMCKEEWERLKSLQREYNIRKYKIIEKMEREYDNDPPKDKKTSEPA